jgi:hypothetical protein
MGYSCAGWLGLSLPWWKWKWWRWRRRRYRQRRMLLESKNRFSQCLQFFLLFVDFAFEL